jgi:hypothetical protein
MVLMKKLAQIYVQIKLQRKVRELLTLLFLSNIDRQPVESTSNHFTRLPDSIRISFVFNHEVSTITADIAVISGFELQTRR